MMRRTLQPVWRSGARRSLARGGFRVPKPRDVAKPAPRKMGAAAQFTVASLGAVALGSLTALAWVSANGEDVAAFDETACTPQCACARRVEIFSELSPTYDGTVGQDELVMGLPVLRWWLLRSARGEVLEVAAGTGSNLLLYPSAVLGVTATDASEAMLELAAAKLAKRAEGATPKVELLSLDVARLDAQLEGRAYDTVLCSFGLCSFEDPVECLVQMQRACRSDGEVLLLEHGRSHYQWLNALLDKYAAKHLERWGCSWNRDIEQIVQDAGLQVRTMRRFHFGTTYFVVAGPDPKLAADPKLSSDAEPGGSRAAA